MIGCIYADPDNLNKFNKSDSGLLAQMYLQLSKSGQSPAAHSMRVWRVEGFERYLILYRSVEHRIDIVRVLHGSRDIAGLFIESV